MIPAVVAPPEAGVVLTKATVRASQLLGLTQAQVGLIIGASAPTVSRIFQLDKQLDPASKAGQLALLLVRVYRSLDSLVGANDEARRKWMSTRNNALRGVPTELMKTPSGLVNTLNYLDGMRAPT
ncbi:MbcA/ParS/Xre antitoxin family protein [Ottowia thiooxydans]|uniref:MbcA/ParS/Xre antitoxin family protein n=1 Tax=Ottowia thiooxydans TaxID=219182 RepID=UPI0003FE8FDE|nr:MbcA/ParS/Xre antitoxin family protein [Ottowia thiooxydans]